MNNNNNNNEKLVKFTDSQGVKNFIDISNKEVADNPLKEGDLLKAKGGREYVEITEVVRPASESDILEEIRTYKEYKIFNSYTKVASNVKKIGEINADQLEKFIDKLTFEFSFTNFNFAAHGKECYEAEEQFYETFSMKYESEFYEGKPSVQQIEAQNQNSFFWKWTTGSGHVLVITHKPFLKSTPNEQFKPSFEVRIGKEASECFYPTVKEMLKEVIGEK